MEDLKSSKRKFNTNFRKKLIETINKITKKEDIIYIFKIINNDIGSNFSENKSGIYFNMNILSDNCIEKIVNYLNNNVDTISETLNEKLIYKTYSENDIDVYNSIGPRLSNQEKSILKKSKNIINK